MFKKNPQTQKPRLKKNNERKKKKEKDKVCFYVKIDHIYKLMNLLFQFQVKILI